MKKRLKKKKEKQLVYETDKLFRWHLCLAMAKVLYRSTVLDYQIEGSIHDLKEFFNNIQQK